MQDSLRFPDRVCNPCGRKIRNLGQLYEFVKAANTSLTDTPIQRSKRTLAMPEKASPSWRKSKSVRVNPRGGGVLPYMGYIGMCGPEGYGFSAVWVINRVSILADFSHFGHK